MTRELKVGNGSLQHVAYSVEPDVDMDMVFNELKQTGMQLMTSVLTYREGTGARRPDGEPFGGFDPENIDDLYQAYDDYSRWLDRQPGAATALS